ncbi:endolytic transglycosylase MltG [uncultured Clostridium sp.]|uniref:endolytic transglycosylase MltG n=1 Tax=uncultured Clostridium sp. TaxID=59620 RepID=UPI002636EF0B|nr:endolytic transglycosylase MltG [uncultured Clostridium sp.]
MGKKKIIISIIVAIVIIIAILVGSFFMAVPSINLLNSNKSVTFIVKKNENLNDVLSTLKNEGNLKYSSLIELYTSVTGENFSVTPGVYTINSKVTAKQFINILKEQKTISVVIPDGATVNDIAGIFNELGMFTTSDFTNAVKNYPLPQYIKDVQGREYNLEGYLYPTTYHFTKGESANQVIETMIFNFVTVLDQSQKAVNVKITPAQINDVLTRASIIQKEAKSENDMPNVSKTLNENLKNKQPLGVQGLGNTLPNGPICNPGQKAIEAALKPAN